jgi:hypothetical protein
MVVADLRDGVGFRWARDVACKTEVVLDAHIALCATRRIIPTIIMGVPKEQAILLLATHTRGISESLGSLARDHVAIVAVSSDGMVGLQFPADYSDVGDDP